MTISTADSLHAPALTPGRSAVIPCRLMPLDIDAFSPRARPMAAA
jgi:hypothetical protein